MSYNPSMDTPDTLFGHLALRFSSHPENLATEALLYLLNKSRDAKGLFAGYLSGHGQEFPPVTRFNSQVSSDDNTIPDLVGTDMAGNNTHRTQSPQTTSDDWAAGRNTRIDLREKVGQLNADYGAGAQNEMASR